MEGGRWTEEWPRGLAAELVVKLLGHKGWVAIPDTVSQRAVPWFQRWGVAWSMSICCTSTPEERLTPKKLRPSLNADRALAPRTDQHAKPEIRDSRYFGVPWPFVLQTIDQQNHDQCLFVGSPRQIWER